MTTIRPSQPVAVGLQQVLPQAQTNPTISGITIDSREIMPGWLYVALPGDRTHGAQFVAKAIEAGAAAVLTDVQGAAMIGATPVPVVVVDDVRAHLGEAAAAVFGRPTSQLITFGVTGTNGKTTTVSLLAAGLRAAGLNAGTIGTLGFFLDGAEIPSERSTVTTPEAPDLQAVLALMRERGARAVGVEVSSHALELGRVGGIHFDVTAFLNLGNDHLDFHGSQEAYFAAKQRLFEPGRGRCAVVWIDDECGRDLARQVRKEGSTMLVTVGTREADYVVSEFAPHGRLGGTAMVTHEGRGNRLTLALPGWVNMIDGVMALAMLEAAGVDPAAAREGLRSAQVPGRMQRAVDDVDAPLVIVDFAHTPQAIAATVESLAQIGPVTTVVGCGGDRDPAKRPLMGEAAAARSAIVIVTDDNPRFEDPAAIRRAALRGARGQGATIIEIADRRAAIEEALRRTGGDGVVAILGKGHERGQIVADQIVEFDDVAVAREAWASLVRQRSAGLPDTARGQGGGR